MVSQPLASPFFTQSGVCVCVRGGDCYIPVSLMPGFCLFNPLQVVVLKESDEAQRRKSKDVFWQTERTVREWLLSTFSSRLLINSHSYTSFNNVCELEVGSLFFSYTFFNADKSRI